MIGGVAPAHLLVAVAVGMTGMRDGIAGHAISAALASAITAAVLVFFVGRERRRAEGALRRAVERANAERAKSDAVRAEDARALLATAVEQVDDMIMITDVDGAIRYVNPAFERITGYSRADVIGEKPNLLRSGKDDPAVLADLDATTTRGETWTGRLVTRAKDGRLFEDDCTVSPVRDATGRIVNFISVNRDVSHLVSLEKQVRLAQRMESVGTLAGGIAHDFNNALTGVLGFGGLLKPQLEGKPEALADLDEVLRAGERAATLTRHLLAFARQQHMDPVNLALNSVVQDMSRLLKKVIGERIEVHTSLREDIPAVFADPGQLEQVVTNLCLNARDAMPSGGRLLVETDVVELGGEFLRTRPHMKPGRYVQLKVSDTGVGMDERTKERVFEPFFTTKGPERGTGLGLSVVYGIVKQHKGFIHVLSQSGAGTTFLIHLPPVAARPDGRRFDTPQAVRGGSEMILLADDEDAVRRLAERALRDYGYAVVSGRSGEEAVELFESHPGAALVLLDIVMPGMGGVEACRRIRTLDPKAKVLFVSAYSLDPAHAAFASRERVPFLAKPFGPMMLARKVRRVLDAGTGSWS